MTEIEIIFSVLTVWIVMLLKNGIVNDLKIYCNSVVSARNPMCGKCTRSVAGNSFLWETVSVSNMRINWDERDRKPS